MNGGSEKIDGIRLEYGAELNGDRRGLSVSELCDRGLKELEALAEDLDRLHQHLPRKFDRRIRDTSDRRAVLRECLRGARDRQRVVERAVASTKGKWD